MTDIENLYKRYAGDGRQFALYLCGDVVMPPQEQNQERHTGGGPPGNAFPEVAQLRRAPEYTASEPRGRQAC